MVIRIGARSSDLARLQALTVGHELHRAAIQLKVPLEIQYSFRESLGDQRADDPLWKMPEKGVFTQDLAAELESGAVDLAVHSWKDLPIENRKTTEIVATLPREDARDMVFLRRDRWEECKQSGCMRVLTSSPRRQYQWSKEARRFLPFALSEFNFHPVRGNIPTRFSKLLNGDSDALFVAKAAVDRLLTADQIPGLPAAEKERFSQVAQEIRAFVDQCLWMVLPLRVFPTAAAQGALAIETRRERTDLRPLLDAIHCAGTFAAVERERIELGALGGGCHQKLGVAVWSRPWGELLSLRGETEAGKAIVREEFSLPINGRKFNGRLSAKDIYPSPNEAPSRVQRRPVNESLAPSVPADALWISRTEAWSADLGKNARVVWTAGLKTWENLARQGVWVHGSSEGLGEGERPRVERLVGRPELRWLRLTHREAIRFEVHESSSQDMPSHATYELSDAKPLTIDRLKMARAYFWMSASQFDRAVQIFPELRTREHACGPGRTHDYLRQQIPSERLNVYPGIEHWWKAMGIVRDHCIEEGHL